MKKNSSARSAAALFALSLAPVSGFAASAPEFEIKQMPVSCRLLPAELRKREATLLTELRKQIVTAHPLTDGYALLLKVDDSTIKLAAEVIAVERQCCSFLQFRLTAAQEGRGLLLEMRGPAGSRELLAQVLQLSTAIQP